MASTARVLEPRRRYEERPQPRIEVRKGNRHESEAKVQGAVTLFRVFAVLLAVVAVVCVGRVFLVNASMATLTEVSAVNDSIGEARALGTQLEAQYYAAANPAQVKAYASSNLGMGAPSVPATTVDLTPDAIKQAVPSTVTGGMEACRNVIAEQEAQAAAAAAASSQANDGSGRAASEGVSGNQQ